MKFKVKFSIMIIAISTISLLIAMGFVLLTATNLLQKTSSEILRASNQSFYFFYTDFVDSNQQMLRYVAKNNDVIDACRDTQILMSYITDRAAAEELNKVKNQNPQIKSIGIMKDGEFLLGDREILNHKGEIQNRFLPGRGSGNNSLIRLQTNIHDDGTAVLHALLDLGVLTKGKIESIRLTDETHFFMLSLESPSLLIHTDSQLIIDLNQFIQKDADFSESIQREGLVSYTLQGIKRNAFLMQNHNLIFGISIPSAYLSLNKTSLFHFTALILLVTSATSVLAGLFSSHILTRPLNKMAQALMGIAEHKFDIRINYEKNDELSVVSHAINTMAEEIKKHTGNLEHLISDRTRKLESAMKELEILTITDSLTGLYNRAFFDRQLPIEFQRHGRSGKSFGMIYMDLDHFKKINDSHGHLTGDHVLKATAQLINENIRDIDMPIRWGGEEFVVILPETNLEGAGVLAEKLRRLMEAMHHEKAGTVTGSFGCTEFREGDDTQSILHRCDSALYRSKVEGRNRVTLG